MRQPRIELGAQRWQRWILPLNHWRKLQGMGIEPTTSAVLKPRHNQLDHPCRFRLLRPWIEHGASRSSVLRSPNWAIEAVKMWHKLVFYKQIISDNMPNNLIKYYVSQSHEARVKLARSILFLESESHHLTNKEHIIICPSSHGDGAPSPLLLGGTGYGQRRRHQGRSWLCRNPVDPSDRQTQAATRQSATWPSRKPPRELFTIDKRPIRSHRGNCPIKRPTIEPRPLMAIIEEDDAWRWWHRK